MADPNGTLVQGSQGQIITLPMGLARRPWVPIRRQSLQFRRWLQADVAAVHGGVDLRQAKLIRTATTAYESAGRIRRLLARCGEIGSDLSVSDWLALDTQLQCREAACDKAIAALAIAKGKRSPQQAVADAIRRIAAERAAHQPGVAAAPADPLPGRLPGQPDASGPQAKA